MTGYGEIELGLDCAEARIEINVAFKRAKAQVSQWTPRPYVPERATIPPLKSFADQVPDLAQRRGWFRT